MSIKRKKLFDIAFYLICGIAIIISLSVVVPEATKEKVRMQDNSAMVGDREVVVFTHNKCKACQALKSFMRGAGVAFIEREISGSEENQKALNELGVNTVPLLVFNDRFVIGYHEDDVVTALKDNGVTYLE